MSAFATAGPGATWYLARGTGLMSLLLLSASVVLGILGPLRFSAAPRWPRFAIDTLHRDVSLLVVLVLVVHILTGVLDGFAPIKLTDAVIPLTSSYRPLWLGLGALAFDLLLALVITSLLRRRLGYRSWRAVHWLAYACWPVAVVHGLGTGTDTKSWWMLALTVLCVSAVVIAALMRIVRARAQYPGIQAPAVALAIGTPLALAIFTLVGPLAPHWARRAGTPARLLGSGSTFVATRSGNSSRGGLSAGPFSDKLDGTVTQTPEPGGALVELALRLSGTVHGRLRVRMAGAPLQSGGLSMTGSQVDLSAVGDPSVLQGQIVSLQGQQFLARVADSAGTVLDLQANLTIDSQTGDVTGTLTGAPAGSG